MVSFHNAAIVSCFAGDFNISSVLCSDRPYETNALQESFTFRSVLSSDQPSKTDALAAKVFMVSFQNAVTVSCLL